MIKRILAWLKSIYYTAPEAETQTEEATPMTDQVVEVTPTPTATEVVTPMVSADTAPTPTAPVSTSPLAAFNARVSEFVAFVEHGINVLGADAEAELVALKDKYL